MKIKNFKNFFQNCTPLLRATAPATRKNANFATFFLKIALELEVETWQDCSLDETLWNEWKNFFPLATVAMVTKENMISWLP